MKREKTDTSNPSIKELPQGWSSAKISTLVHLVNGRAFKPSEWETSGLPIVRIQNLNNPGASFNYSRNKFDEKFLIDTGTLVFAWSGTPGTSFGAHIWKGGKAWLNQHIFKVVFDENLINKKYLRFAINQNLSEYINNAHGGAGLAHITKGKFDSSEIPLPPLAEQHRIVAKIEELFSDLDAGIASLKQAQAQLKTYRQAVLKYAFEGKLTAAWREENKPEPAEKLLAQIKVGATRRVAQTKRNGNLKKPKEFPPLTEAEQAELPELPEGWCWVKLGNLSWGVEYGSAKKSKQDGKIPVIRMGNLQNGIIDWNDLVYTEDEDEINQYLLRREDVLFNRTNSPELVGKTAIYKGERAAIFAGYLIRINQMPDIDARYLTYFLNSHIAKNHGNRVKTDGVNQSNINGEKLCHYPFPLASREEQRQIVQEIESRLSVCDKLEESIKESLQKAEALRQSILKKAFAGKLVPQDPNDEPAEKLLERIRAENIRLEQNANAKRK